jgi:hypothetical protein
MYLEKSKLIVRWDGVSAIDCMLLHNSHVSYVEYNYSSTLLAVCNK